jgi:hypothetical protein
VVAVIQIVPQSPPSDGGVALELVLLTCAIVAALAGVALWLLVRRTTSVAWVGRVEARGPAVWRVPARLRAPERIAGHLSWGSDGRHADALAESILRWLRARPAAALVRGFADEVLSELPDDGFVLHESAVRAWLHARADAEPRAREAVS